VANLLAKLRQIEGSASPSSSYEINEFNEIASSTQFVESGVNEKTSSTHISQLEEGAGHKPASPSSSYEINEFNERTCSTAISDSDPYEKTSSTQKTEQGNTDLFGQAHDDDEKTGSDDSAKNASGTFFSKPSNESNPSGTFFSQISQFRNLEEEKLELPTLTAWDLLRADFHHLLDNGLNPEDTRGSITVVSDGPTGMVIGCNLRDAKELASHCRALKEKHPNPLEIRISAQHDQTMHLRSRHTLAMAQARSGVGLSVKA
jgi:hypothetical protein